MAQKNWTLAKIWSAPLIGFQKQQFLRTIIKRERHTTVEIKDTPTQMTLRNKSNSIHHLVPTLHNNLIPTHNLLLSIDQILTIITAIIPLIHTTFIHTAITICPSLTIIARQSFTEMMKINKKFYLLWDCKLESARWKFFATCAQT